MATQTAGDSEGEDLRQERSLDTGLSGEQIALLMAEVTGLKKAVVERQNEMAKMIVKRTRERQHSFLRPGNQSQYDFTDAVLGQVQDALRDLEYGSTEETREAAVHSLQKAAEMLERRMKLIKMADRSEYGWAVVAEYESDELAVDSDDEKRISRAEKEAEKKWLRKRKRQIDDRVDGARGVTGATQPRATSNVGATPRAGPCFGCASFSTVDVQNAKSVSIWNPHAVPMIALGWKDKTLKRFLSTCGTTVEGQPHTKKRYRVSEDGESSEIFYKTVKRPKLVEEYFDSASKIDVHNHLRQGSLALEEAWGTRKWHHRVFASILGMVEVDAFLLYSALHLDGKSMEHRTFTERLALSLITNTYGVPVSPHTRSLRSPQQSESASTDTAHLFMPLTTLHQYESKQGSAGGARRKCLVCVRVFKEQNNGHYFCSTCSQPPEGLIVTVCGMSSDRGSRCMDWHRERGIPEL
ncbi:hypothetical protein EMCRGX_G015926 [Ephydatia muelleri]